MRPEKLEMKGFGPYMEASIDFTLLGENGLYLITGETGAGKSAIFDAISFSLFGLASSSGRSLELCRSRYAGDDDESYVDFSFRIGSDVYRIRRSPEYKKKGKDGKIRSVSSSVALYLPSGRIITKIAEANGKIVEIIGLRRDQFKSVMMLSQGEFSAIFKANSKERSAIFRDLFHTENIKRFQMLLSDEAKKKEERFLEKEREYISECSYLSLEEDVNINDSNEVQKFLESREEEMRREMETLLLEKNECERKVKDLDRAIGVLEKEEKLKAELEKEEKKEKEDRKKEEKIKEREKEIRKKRIRKEDVRESVLLLEKEKEKYRELEKRKERWIESRNKIIDAGKNKSELQKKLENKSKEKEQLEEKIKCLSTDGGLPADVEKKIAISEERDKRLDALGKEAKSLNVLLSSRKNEEKEYEELREKYLSSDKRRQEMEDLYLSSQAGILARHLSDGKPCPVCGSLIHPSPAVENSGSYEKEDIDNIRRKTEKEHGEWEKKAHELSTLNGIISEREEKVRSEAWELLACDDLQIISDVLDQEKRNVQDELEALKENRDMMIANLRELEESRKNLAEVSALLSDISSEIKSIESGEKLLLENAREKKELYEELLSSLSHPSLASLNETIEKQEDEMTRLEIEIDTYEKEKNEIEKTILSRQGKIEMLRKSIGGENGGSDSTLLKEERNIISTAFSENEDKVRQLSLQLDNLTLHKKAIERILPELREMEKERDIYTGLSNLAEGKAIGSHIAFESFVQAFYFDRVLMRANEKFLRISSGQFEMRRTDRRAGTGQKGLDLVLIDHFSGSERDITTLSGGESFMASLSLSFALSEEVEHASGGRRIESIFIDEGFGSLSDTPLENVVDLLHMLSGGKAIGIISHVKDLKERIPRQIVVKKRKEGGSTLSLVL